MKIKYLNREEAKQVRKKLTKKYHQTFKIYKCPTCAYLHVGQSS